MVERQLRAPPPRRRAVAAAPAPSCATGTSTPPTATARDEVVLGAGDHLHHAARPRAGRRCCRRWPRPPARSAARRSATPGRSAATSAPARPRATRCPCWWRSARTVELARATGRRRLPVAELPHRAEAHALRPGELHRRRAGAGGAGAGRVPEDRRAQRHGHRRRQLRAWWSTDRAAHRAVRAGRRSGRCRSATPRPRRGPPTRLDWDAGAALRPRRWPPSSAPAWPRPAARSTTTGPPPPTAATRSACWPARALERAFPGPRRRLEAEPRAPGPPGRPAA